jgi:hypothetical protein
MLRSARHDVLSSLFFRAFNFFLLPKKFGQKASNFGRENPGNGVA